MYHQRRPRHCSRHTSSLSSTFSSEEQDCVSDVLSKCCDTVSHVVDRDFCAVVLAREVCTPILQPAASARDCVKANDVTTLLRPAANLTKQHVMDAWRLKRFMHSAHLITTKARSQKKYSPRPVTSTVANIIYRPAGDHWFGVYVKKTFRAL